MPLESKISCYNKQDTSFIKQWNFQFFLWFLKLIAGVSLARFTVYWNKKKCLSKRNWVNFVANQMIKCKIFYVCL